MAFVGEYVGSDGRRLVVESGCAPRRGVSSGCEAPAKVTLRALLGANMMRLGLTPAAIDTLVMSAHITPYRTGQTVSATAGSDDLVHFLINGAVRVTCTHDGVEPMTVRFIRPGQFFSLTPLSDEPSPPSFGAAAHEPALVAAVGREAMRQVLMTLPPANALTFVAHSWRVLLRLVFDKCVSLMSPLRERVATSLELLAQDFGAPHARGVLIDLPLTHQDVAQLAVASRANVSRCLSSMRRDGRLDVEGRRFVLIRG
jgi:CRP/FNR family transcriptional regulator